MSVKSVKELTAYTKAYRLSMLIFEISRRFPVEEAGAALGLSRAMAYRNWKYARAWLRDALGK